METGKNFKKLVLPNGLTIILYTMDSVMSASGILFVRTGAVFESEDKRGISHLVEHSAFIGTEKYPSSATISNTAENLGIFFNGATSKDSTHYTIKAPHTNFNLALDLLGQFLFAPLLREGQIVKEKEAILSEYNDFWNDPVRKFDHEIWRKRFSQEEHPYSRRPMGKPGTIKNLELRDVLDWRQKYYNPANMVLGVAGNFKTRELEHLIGKLFSPAVVGSRQEEPKFSSQEYSDFTVYHQEDERPQITFSLTFPVFGWRQRARKERLGLRLLNFILGSSRSSRLYARLREKERFVYKVHSDYRLHSWMGGLVISGSTPVGKLGNTLGATKEEVDGLLEGGISEKELNLAKNFWIAQTLLQFDNPGEIARYFAEQIFYDEDVWTAEERIKEIRKITKSEIDSLVKEVFDFSRINIGLLGNIPSEKMGGIEGIFRY